MIDWLLANTLYIKVYRDRLELQHIESGNSISANALKPFTTTRLLVGQFNEADELLKNAFKRLYKPRWFSPKPMVIIQPMEKTDGGLSQVEERVFLELAAGVGARRSVVWVGHELSDREVTDKSRSL